MTKKPILYFLCTGNSCRSQMAEGFGKKYLGDEWDVRSAGLDPQGIHSLAIQAMKEVGIDISSQSPEEIDRHILSEATMVVTLCGDAREQCPTIPPHINHEHWEFEDPAKAVGTDEDIWQVFVRIRDQIQSRIQTFKQGGV